MPSTTGAAINKFGEVAGTVTTGRAAGFMRFADGRFRHLIKAPDAGPLGTVITGINDARTLSGYFLDNAFVQHGLFWSAGVFTQFDAPDSAGTDVVGLNNAGDFVGSFDTDPPDGFYHAFVDIAGTYTVLNLPGSGFSSAEQINDAGEVVGFYEGDDSLFHGFYRDAAGNLSTIDVPGSTGTLLLGINNRGEMVGTYYDNVGGQHGLFFRPPHTFLTYDYPGATKVNLHGINNAGTISGIWVAGNPSVRHGLIVQVVKRAGN